MAIPRGISNEQFRTTFFQENPNFFSGGSADINSLSRADRRNPQFRSLLGSGQLVPTGGVTSVEDDFLARLSAIGGGGLLGAKAEVPQEFIDAFNNFNTQLNQTRTELGNFARGVREGDILPFTTSEAQRTRLIDRAEGDLTRILDQSTEAQFGELSRRGLLPSSQTGFSGPAADVLSRVRAQTFEDPLTSFISDLDIQTEADFVGNRNRLRELGVNVDQFLAGNALDAANTSGQFGLGIGQLDLGNLQSQRGFANNLLGQLNAFQQTQLAEEAFNRDQSLLSEAIFESEDAARKADKNTFGNLLGNIGGRIFGGAAGSFGGVFGSSLGSQLGQKLGSNLFKGSPSTANTALPSIPTSNPFTNFNASLNPNLRLPTFGQSASFF